MPIERRLEAGRRVQFESAVQTKIMAIDGTWARECEMSDVSDGGAKLRIKGAFGGLNLNEFFLILSSTGAAYRRCELRWCHGDMVGVKFIKAGKKKGAAGKGGEANEARAGDNKLNLPRSHPPDVVEV